LLVRQFGKQINDGINTALQNRKWENRQATKVVPIVSIGGGVYAGAAQVIGEEGKGGRGFCRAKMFFVTHYARSVMAMNWQRVALAFLVVIFLSVLGRSCWQRRQVLAAEPSLAL